MVIHAALTAINGQSAAVTPGTAAESPPEPPVLRDRSHTTDEAHARTPSVMPLTVRQLRMLDLPDLRHLDHLSRLNQPRAQLQAYNVPRAGLRAALPGLRGRRPAFVARSGDRLVGFAQFQPEEPDERWNVLVIGTAMGVYESGPVLEAMLEHGVRSAGLRGVKRLFAKVPPDSVIGEAFRRQAWSPYANEVVYAAELAGRASSGARLLRPQQNVDTWAIHQLYNATVPKPVQDAEALTSHHWDVQPAKQARSGAVTSGWLIEDGHLVIGYARITASVRACLVDFVYNHERRDILPTLIDQALDVARLGPGHRVYCAVRGYQAELATALEARGFASQHEQDQLIKYTTATVRLPVVEAVPFQLEVGEKIPQRVPTFLQGRSGDGAAS